MWNLLKKAVKHIGGKVVSLADKALNGVAHIGGKIYNAVGTIPIVGSAIKGAIDTAIDTPVFKGMSLRGMYDKAKDIVEVGKKLTGSDSERAEAFEKALNGDYGEKPKLGAEAVERIARAIQ